MDDYKEHHQDTKDLEMVVQQLHMIKAAVDGLMEHLEVTPGCPHITEAWVQSKMTLASSYIDSVHDYVVNAHGQKDPLKKGENKVYSESDDDDDYEKDEDGGGSPVGFLVAIERGLSKR